MSDAYPRHLSFPFRIGPDGRTAQVSSREEHVHDQLIQLLLTNPAERLFLPEFGGGVRRLVFEPLAESTRGMTKAMITQAIVTWLGELVTLQDVQVTIEDTTVDVVIVYRLAGVEDTRVLRLQRTGD